MPYTYTVDERYGNTVFSSSAGTRDVPNYLNQNYVIAEGALNVAYGLLSDDYFTADIDTYSLGTLSQGIYRVSVQDVNWDYFYSEFGSVSQFEVLNSFGFTVASSMNTWATLDFAVYSPADYYIRVTGPSFSEAEYSISSTDWTDVQSVESAIAFMNENIDSIMDSPGGQTRRSRQVSIVKDGVVVDQYTETDG